MHTITAVIQARLGSTRLPGKTMLLMNGESLLGHLLKRIRKSKHIHAVIVATTTEKKDDPIVEFAMEHGLKYYRGSEDDVLDRFYQTVGTFRLETIVRVTPDCPLLDPRVADRVIEKYLSGSYDYVSNVLEPTYPDGFDTEVFSAGALAKAWREARLPSEREHVTAYIVKHPELFRLCNVRKDGEDLSSIRLTVDTRNDYEFISRVLEKLGMTDDIFHLEDILRVLKENPELMDINRGIGRNEGYQLSLLKDGQHENNT